MTPEQKADEMIACFGDEKLKALFGPALKEAFFAGCDFEREACAKIVEQDAISGDWPPATVTAAAIRARGTQ